MILCYCNRCKKRMDTDGTSILAIDHLIVNLDKMDIVFDDVNNSPPFDRGIPIIESKYGRLEMLNKMQISPSTVLLCRDCADDFGKFANAFYNGAKIMVTEDEGKDKEKNE